MGCRLVADTADYTPQEPFTQTLKPGHPYAAAIEWATTRLGEGHGRDLLVIGSCFDEARTLQRVGWQTQYIDWRWSGQEIAGVKCQQGDALALPFRDATFGAVSTTCVMCHVGLGRYGDPVQDDAEATMLRECRRVLRNGGRVAMMTGPCIVGEPVTIGAATHRVTTLNHVLALVRAVSFTLVDYNAFIPTERRWRIPGEPWATNPEIPDYLCVALEAV